jgi:acetyl esterase/lipase
MMIVFALVSNSDAKAQIARQELIPFQSMTLSDADFLKGTKEGTQVTIAGHLRLPRAGNEKLPAVVLLHGAAGVGGTGTMIEEWVKELGEIGIATFVLDSYSGRGLVQLAIDQTQLGELTVVVDAFRALEVLAKHRQIDPARIAVMGFSRGGQAALYSSLSRFQSLPERTVNSLLLTWPSMHLATRNIVPTWKSRSRCACCTERQILGYPSSHAERTRNAWHRPDGMFNSWSIPGLIMSSMHLPSRR